LSFTTNTTSNRLKITRGWAIGEFYNDNYSKIIANLSWFKTYYILKNFLKFTKWHLLSLQQIKSRDSLLFLITAHRLPKKNRAFNAAVKWNGINSFATMQLRAAMRFKKRVGLVRRHFIDKKKIFLYSHKAPWQVGRNLLYRSYTNSLNSKIEPALYKKYYLLKTKGNRYIEVIPTRKKPRFFFFKKRYFTIQRYKVISLMGLREAARYRPEKSINTKVAISGLNQWFNKYGKYNFDRREWEHLILSKKFKLQIAPIFWSGIKVTEKNKTRLVFRNTALKANKVRKLKGTIDLLRANNTNKYQNKKCFHGKINRRKIFFFNLKILNKKYLGIATKKLVLFKSQIHLHWKQKYLTQILRYSQLKNQAMEFLIRRKNLKVQIRAALFKKRRFIRLFVDKKHYNKVWRNVFKARKKQLLLKKLTRKITFNTFRLNYFFKKFIWTKLAKMSIIKFKQPARFLVSMKKVRSIASKKRSLFRYKRQVMYKRIIPLLALLTHYFQLQPLADQIAYELERTRKHWPLLKGIRALIQKLRPQNFTGYRIAIRGKINASDRTRTFFIKNGQPPKKTFSKKMYFSMCQSKARTGSFGIKVWFYND